jgi:hypothetical protein
VEVATTVRINEAESFCNIIELRLIRRDIQTPETSLSGEIVRLRRQRRRRR